MSDHHVHPDYSIDAEGSIDDYCRAAVAIGLREICFTTHYDADPARSEREGYMVIEGNREPLSEEGIEVYLNDLRRAYVEYGPLGLTVKAGIEFGYFDGCEGLLADVQSALRLDYRLGAVHSIGALCICCREDSRKLFAKFSLDQLADRYFECLELAATSGLFDCLAHLDIYRRYGTAHYGEKINTIHRGRIEKLFAVMKKHNVGYEINTSAIRHGLFEYYPNMEIVNEARKAGVRLMALGSDAHRPDQMALDFDAAAAVAYELFPYVDE
jgi:histidinol-phosphatase (PHP family)